MIPLLLLLFLLMLLILLLMLLMLLLMLLLLLLLLRWHSLSLLVFVAAYARRLQVCISQLNSGNGTLLKT